MNSLSPAQILDIWEQGHDQHPLDRALTMLAPIEPQMTRYELAELSIGMRDTRLLLIYGQTFGNSIDALACCPNCSEELEFSIQLKDLFSEPDSNKDQSYKFSVDKCQIEFRLPDSRDLAAIVDCENESAGRQVLIERCLLKGTNDGSQVYVTSLPEVISALSDKISAYDPQADVLLDLYCPLCSHSWQTIFDIVSFLWEEISVRARCLIYEIHTLAVAYGWSEQEILSLSPVRRRKYMEMVL